MAIQTLTANYILHGNENDDGSYSTVLIDKKNTGDGRSGLYAFFKTFTATSSLLVNFPKAFADIIPYNISWVVPQEYLYEAGGWTLCPLQYILKFFRTEKNDFVFEINLISLLSFSNRNYDGSEDAFSVTWRFYEKDRYITRSIPFPVFNKVKNEPDFILFDVMAVLPEDINTLVNYIGSDGLCDIPCISFSARVDQNVTLLPLINIYPSPVATTCISFAPIDFFYLAKLPFPRTQWIQTDDSLTYYMLSYQYTYWGTISTVNYTT